MSVLVEPDDFLRACMNRWGDKIDVILSDNYGERVIRNALQKMGLRVPYIREPFGYQLTPRIRRFREAVMDPVSSAFPGHCSSARPWTTCNSSPVPTAQRRS